jgi:hypothetical protein
VRLSCGARTDVIAREIKLLSSGMGGYVDEGDRLCNRLGVEVAVQRDELRGTAIAGPDRVGFICDNSDLTRQTLLEKV